MPNSTRCRLHGAVGGRPKGHPEHPNSLAARLKGRRLWVEKMRRLKAAGVIDKFPNGRRAKDLPPLSRDPKIRKAQRLVERAMAASNSSDREVDRPWEGLSRGEKLSRAADLALDCAKQILELGIDPSDAKTLAIVKDTALTIISQQIRVEERHSGQMPPDAEPRKIEVTFVGPNSAEPAEPAPVELPMIASQAEYDALPGGSHFLLPLMGPRG